METQFDVWVLFLLALAIGVIRFAYTRVRRWVYNRFAARRIDGMLDQRLLSGKW